jgi:hypothetical protein
MWPQSVLKVLRRKKLIARIFMAATSEEHALVV